MTLQLELLAELRAALAEHDLRSQVREDVAALAVDRGTETPLWVFVGISGRYFSWGRAEYQHPVRDVAGAARRIAEQVTAQHT